ncbi:hypothetical protein RUM8411_04532 [Ruegeria meonggei]|uniref:Uncharacterized protein n=1 Tax=Ruegeria meonggei TaxID=1446476 RepID=A0A1X7ADQ6_9RHOB|nr:hypothetical protein RUM8411_04532 [Ruegeria meonggei]
MEQLCLNVRSGHSFHQRAIVHLESHFRSHALRRIVSADDNMIACCTDESISRRHRKPKNVRILLTNGED